MTLSAAKAHTNTFRTVNINVKNNPVMPQQKVRHDVQRAALDGSLIGWNEIGPDRYFAAIKQLGKEWGHYMPHDGKMRIPNPISWKKSIWKELDSGFVKTHGGKEKVSPARYITWSKLEHRDSHNTIVRVNTHLVSGAFTAGKTSPDWRRNHWHEHMRELKELVSQFESKGFTVIVGGDFNRDSHKVLGNKVAYDNNLHVATHGRHSTYDYLMHTRSDHLKRIGGHVDTHFRSDHHAVIARYSIK
jgi:hypothetical protein